MLAISEMAFKTVMANSGGMMGHSIEETTTMARDKVMVNFITPRIQVSVGASGREVYSMDRANMLRARTSASSAYGATVDW